MQGRLDTSKLCHGPAASHPQFWSTSETPIAASIPFTNQATEAQGRDVKQGLVWQLGGGELRH